MCGILGAVNAPIHESLLNLIRHRGPDGAGITTMAAGHHQVTFAHRRLAIVDLSPAGHQPMQTASGGQVLIFNGEIYNHLDLRRGHSDVRFRGHSDTETLLTHLSRRGMAGAADLNGIFAFGFLDRRKPALYLVRDPFGVKPLYYSIAGNRILFASEMRPLAAALDPACDPESLVELLTLRYVPSPGTLFRGIRKVRPGHVVEIALGGPDLAVREYPFAPAFSGHTARLSDADAREQYGALVTQAVERQLMADVPVGVLLSGGIDSALVASAAQRASRYRMKAFTVGFTGDHAADEIAAARETAATLGLEHHAVRLGAHDFLAALPRITSIVEEPLATTSVIPMFALARLASQHVKVVLSGQGADEAMGGYRRYRSELLRSYLPQPALAQITRASRWLTTRNETWNRAIESCGTADDVARFESVYRVFDAEQILRLTGHSSSRASESIRYHYDCWNARLHRDSAARMMSVDLRMNLADDLLLYTDKITMHHSLECRVPFLDLPLVRFAESLPARQRLSVFRAKRLHRGYGAQVLPQAIVRRKKLGFVSPTREWFRKSGPVAGLLLDPTSRFAQHFDVREVRRILDQHDRGLNRERHIFLLLSLHAWMAESRKASPAIAL